MLAETAQSQLKTDTHHKASFFRQSGWMMIATVGSGVLMSLVHLFNKPIGDTEYSMLVTLIQLLNWMTIPAIGLQITFAQQTSAAVTDEQRRRLVGTVWAVARGIFYIWLGMLVVTWICHARVITALKITNPVALWITLVIALVMLWRPLFQGLLQGRQNFLWLGWGFVFDGIGRLFIAGFFVLVFHGLTASILTGAFIGMAAALGVGLWQNQDFWGAPGSRFESREWLRRVIPLSIGYGTSQFLFSADAIMVQSHLDNNAPYFFGGTLARAIVLFTAPLATVMFPKLVHNAARNQKSSLMMLTLVGTIVLGALAAVGLIIVCPWLIRLGSKSEYLSIVPLMPLFAGNMLPLAAGNVLLNNLMAHSRFKCVPFLAVVAVGYWIALCYFHDSFKTVLLVMGAFNTLFLAVCAFFTWVVDHDKPAVSGDDLPQAMQEV